MMRSHIMEFLNVYQRFRPLWSYEKTSNYLPSAIFQRLFNELDEKQLIG